MTREQLAHLLHQASEKYWIEEAAFQRPLLIFEGLPDAAKAYWLWLADALLQKTEVRPR